MSDAVHLLIPFAACRAEGFGKAARALALPNLGLLLARLAPEPADAAGQPRLSMPHERVLARAWGLDAAADGCIPWAACEQAGADGGEADAAWAWITPCHWKVGTDHVAMVHPGELRLEAAQSRAFLEAMRPYFEQDGLQLGWQAPAAWVARGEIFRGLPAASLDRVIGQPIDPWLPRGAQAGTLRRLQQEMQMLLYTHPLNDERAAAGLPPVNSFWISGAGALPVGTVAVQPTDARPADAAPAAHPAARAAEAGAAGGVSQPAAAQHFAFPPVPPGTTVVHGLRDAALRADLDGWAAAWREADAGPCARLLAALSAGRPVRLSLCGEHGARSWSSEGRGWRQRLAPLLPRPVIADILESL